MTTTLASSFSLPLLWWWKKQLFSRQKKMTTKLEFSFPCPLLWNEIMKQAKIEEQIAHKKAVLKDIEKYESKYFTNGNWHEYYQMPNGRAISVVICDERLWYARTDFIKCDDGESVDINRFSAKYWYDPEAEPATEPTEWHHESIYANEILGIYEDIYDELTWEYTDRDIAKWWAKYNTKEKRLAYNKKYRGKLAREWAMNEEEGVWDSGV